MVDSLEGVDWIQDKGRMSEVGKVGAVTEADRGLEKRRGCVVVRGWADGRTEVHGYLSTPLYFITSRAR